LRANVGLVCFPVNPCNLEYVFGSPILQKATINLEDGKKFEMIAENVSDKNIYIQSVTFNGKPYTKTWINHNDIVNGGTLIFKMGKNPNKTFGTTPDAFPPVEVQGRD
jgi:putative alpha-1,2-mannosidase